MAVLIGGGGGWEYDKRRDKEPLRGLDNIYNYILIPPPKIVVLKEISFNCGNAAY